MHHDENNRWHTHHRNQPQRQQPYEEDHFNDFGSRWGDPTPLFTNRPDEWQTREESYSRRGRHPQYRKEWLPDQHRQEQRNHEQHNYGNRNPEWQQQDMRFNPDNQQANDRWLDDSYIPHPHDRHSRRQFPYDDFRDDRRW